MHYAVPYHPLRPLTFFRRCMLCRCCAPPSHAAVLSGSAPHATVRWGHTGRQSRRRCRWSFDRRDRRGTWPGTTQKGSNFINFIQLQCKWQQKATGRISQNRQVFISICCSEFLAREKFSRLPTEILWERIDHSGNDVPTCFKDKLSGSPVLSPRFTKSPLTQHYAALPRIKSLEIRISLLPRSPSGPPVWNFVILSSSSPNSLRSSVT